MGHLVKKKGLTVRLSHAQKRLLRQAAELESVARGRRITAGELLRDSGLRRASGIVRRADKLVVVSETP